MIRLFVAIPLPDAVRRALAGLAGGVPGANWTAPENFHVTLRFIGEVEDPWLADAAAALAEVRGEPFALQVAGVDFFGDRKRARIIYAGVRGGEPLLQLQRRVERALARAGLPAEQRRYHPHVTLARLKGAPLERVGRFLEAHGTFACPPLQVARFALFSSWPSGGGPQYREEADYPLPPAATSA